MDRGAAGSAGEGGRRLWGGRFRASPAASLHALNRSLPVDIRLWREDLEGSIAWASALADAGVLTDAESATLIDGLGRVGRVLDGGDFTEAPDEDIHSLIERLLYEEVGDVAGKLHTGRSRNDQVVTAFRLWTLRAGAALDEELRRLQATLLALAERSVEQVMPAYTHLRRAQPVRVAHWILSHFWPLQRDRERLGQALDRVSELPLGSGAVGGCAFPVDRERLRQSLGFRRISRNSMDAVTDRDWVCEAVFALGLLAAHLSRLAEDLILFSSDEFGFVRLPEAYTTGSSLLPQKRNPDGLELARAKAARLSGQVAGALALLKGLPSGYQKDLQEDKSLLFEAVDTLASLLPVTRETVAGLVFDDAALRLAAGDPALLATDLADVLVRRGVPFREAHAAVGRLLRAAEDAGVSVPDLPDPAWAAAHPALLEGGRPELTVEGSVEARAVPGGSARAAVLDQLRLAAAAIV